MTRSPCALIVAHGSPADPEPQEAALQALAQAVGALRPGWTVRGATLAAPGALEAALAGLSAPLIYPFFMAEGWFTGRELPRRLRAAGITDARQLPPFGVDPDLPDLMARVATEAAQAAGMAPAAATLLLAAHGSKISRTSADSTHAMARALADRTAFRRITCGFVEEAPFLADAARDLGPGVCLPFFALRAGHVIGDVPEALAEAGFDGPLLPEIGAHPQVAALIAASLLRAAQT
jgi:sirohydrochlorin ferrochelatase